MSISHHGLLLTAGGRGDPDFTKTSLLALFGAGVGVTTFVDSSSYAHPLTRGAPAQETTAQTKFGRTVLDVAGTGGYVRAANNAAFQFGNGDFTIEAWVYRTAGSTSERAIVTMWRSSPLTLSWYFGVNASGQLFFYYSTNGTSGVFSAAGGSVTSGVWSHVAACRSGSSLRLFVNGVLVVTHNIGTATLNSGGTAPLTIGNEGGSSVTNQWWLGCIGPVRVKKGQALYTGNFTPPTTLFPDY